MRETVRSLRRLFMGFAGLHGLAAFVIATGGGGAGGIIVVPVAVWWIWVAASLRRLLRTSPGACIGVCAVSGLEQLASATDALLRGSDRAVLHLIFLALLVYMAVNVRRLSRESEASASLRAARVFD